MRESGGDARATSIRTFAVNQNICSHQPSEMARAVSASTIPRKRHLEQVDTSVLSTQRKAEHEAALRLAHKLEFHQGRRRGFPIVARRVIRPTESALTICPDFRAHVAPLE